MPRSIKELGTDDFGTHKGKAKFPFDGIRAALLHGDVLGLNAREGVVAADANVKSPSDGRGAEQLERDWKSFCDLEQKARRWRYVDAS